MRAIELARAKCSTHYCIVQSVMKLKRDFSTISSPGFSSNLVLANIMCMQLHFWNLLFEVSCIATQSSSVGFKKWQDRDMNSY